ncbi:phytoene/squalene synthase family protein [Lysobacter fragariae]
MPDAMMIEGDAGQREEAGSGPSGHGAPEETGLASFTGKWRARWPEWAIADVFVPMAQREAALAWATLQQELTDAAWGGADPRPGEAKLAWWMEELQGWSRGIRRHPLGVALQKLPAGWTQLAAALPSLRDSRERPADADEARAQVLPFAQAVCTVEQGVLGSMDQSHQPTEAVIVCLLHARLSQHPGEAVPLQVLARVGSDAAVTQWSHDLADGRAQLRQAMRTASRARRVWTGLALARLAQGEPVQPLARLAALWASWRAARS